MKILLLGRDGQVGWELQRALSVLGSVVAVGKQSDDGLSGDLEDQQGLRQTIEAVKPDVIVNAAAFTDVERAEAEPDVAQRINADAPGVLAEEAQARGSLLIQYSTDYVFDGSGSGPWTEASSARPLNEYGKSKLAGDLAIQNSGCDYLIFRTSWVFSARGHNFLKTIARLMIERDSLSIVDDQFGAPTSAELIADVTAHALAKVYKTRRLGGLYNLVSGGVTSWHQYACFIAEWMRKQGVEGVMPVQSIIGVATADYQTAARRPLNSRLDTQRLESAFDLHLPPWSKGVHRALSECMLGEGSFIQ